MAASASGQLPAKVMPAQGGHALVIAQCPDQESGRLVRHARRLVFQLAEVAVPRVIPVRRWRTGANQRAPCSARVTNILGVFAGDEG